MATFIDKCRWRLSAELHPVFFALLPIAAALIAAWGLPIWPYQPREHAGDQIGIQIACAGADRGTLMGWLIGPSIDERTYRPLCMLLHAAEFRFWSLRDILYSWLSAVAHLGNAGLLAVLTASFACGKPAVRMCVGLLAALIFAGPYFSDDPTLRWMIEYWPSQSDAFALLFALIGLVNLNSYVQQGRRSSLVWALVMLAISCLFKEIGYAALIAGLALVWPWRGRNRLAILGLAALWIVLFAARSMALRGHVFYQPGGSITRTLRVMAGSALFENMATIWPIIAAGAGLGVLLLFKQLDLNRWVGIGLAAVAVSAAAHVLGGHYLMAWMSPNFDSVVAGGLGLLILAAGLSRFGKDARVRAVAIGWLAASYAVSPLKFVLGWYHYWPEAFRAVLIALLAPEAFRLAVGLFGRKVITTEEQASEIRGLGALSAILAAGVAFIAAAAFIGMRPLTTEPLTLQDGSRWLISGPRLFGTPTITILGKPASGKEARSVESACRALSRLGYTVLRRDDDRPVTAEAAAEWLSSAARSVSGDPSNAVVIGWGDSGSVAAELALRGSVRCGADFSGLPPSTSQSKSPLFLACSKAEAPTLLPTFNAIAAHSPLNSVAVFNSPYDGPVFPRESGFWMRSAHKGIEFIVQKMPPPE